MTNSFTDLESRPVGVLDSGLGGLSVLKSLRAALPCEDFLYCADSGHAPWGDRPQAYVLERCRAISNFLIARGAKAIVLACNTATAIAADALRRELSLPIIGIEPAVKPAAAASRTGAIGVLATTATIESARYKSLISRYAGSTRVVSVAAPGLMECVEKGAFAEPETLALLHRYLAPMQEAGIDKLVLGCTHYPFLSEQISTILGSSVELIEPGRAVAAQTKTRLMKIHALRKANATHDQKPREVFFISDKSAHEAVLKRLWPQAQKALELTG